MQPQQLWLVLAGFVLGFAVSTLWEWLYYRRQRWQRGRTFLPPEPPREPEINAFEAENLVVAAPVERFYTEYRSPGVYLESEQEQVRAVRQEPDPAIAPPAATWVETRIPRPVAETQSIPPNPLAPLTVEQALSAGRVDDLSTPRLVPPAPAIPIYSPQLDDAAAIMTVPDDLTAITGIDATVQDKLYQAGVTSYAHLATMTPAGLAAIVTPPTGETTYDFADWIEQAAYRSISET